MALVRHALDTSITEGTKRQKSSLLRYWGMNCAAFVIDMERCGTNPQVSENEMCDAICNECMILAGFLAFWRRTRDAIVRTKTAPRTLREQSGPLEDITST